MAWCRIHLTEDERRIVNEERASHPNLLVRNKMLTIWLLHCGVTRQKAAEIVGVSRATVQRYVDAYCKGGLDGLRHSSVQKAVSELAAFRDIIRASFEEAPVCTIAEACDRIEKLTGIRRSPTQVRKFLKALPAFQGVTNWNSPQLLSQQALIRGGGSRGNPATSVCHTRV